MNFSENAFRLFRHTGLEPHYPALQAIIEARCQPELNGHIPKWEAALAALPRPTIGSVKAIVDAPVVGSLPVISENASDEAVDEVANRDKAGLRETLMAFAPWRKGPFELYGVYIDTEWRSDYKWQRIIPHLEPLDGRTVLDVGCGNGYHLWRMLGAGAKRVLGIDPNLLFNYQFAAVARSLGEPSGAAMLPLGADDIPPDLRCFDTVFSMGVLYHRKSPFDHLFQLRGMLRQGGQLVLETLIVEGDTHTVLTPDRRYGKMRNVWFIPSVDACMQWLKRCGYSQIACVDVNQTSLEEQRRTPWMQFESLANFLDPADPSKTVEGYPAPKRATFTAVA